MYRIGGCPRCGGTQYREPDTGEWACMACSYRPWIVTVVYHEEREVLRQTNADIEILGVTVKFHDAEGHPHKIRGDGVLGACLQHEIDHMDGITINDPAEFIQKT